VTAVRIATAAVLIPAVVAAVWWGSPAVVAALVGLIVVLALLEFFKLGERVGLQGYRCGRVSVHWRCCSSSGPRRRRRKSLWAQRPHHSGLDRVAASTGIDFFHFCSGRCRQPIRFSSSAGFRAGRHGHQRRRLAFHRVASSALVRLDGVPMIGPRLLLFTLVLYGRRYVGLLYRPHDWPMAHGAPVEPRQDVEGAAANLLASLAVGAAFARWLHIDGREVMAMADWPTSPGRPATC